MPKIHNQSRRLPPDSRGRKRYLDIDGRTINVKVGIGHPLGSSNGWATEKRVVVYESGVDLGPGDKVFNRDHDFLNNNLDNLVVVRPGEPFPWPKKQPPPCACGCGQRTANLQRKYLDGHRPTWRTIQDEFSDRPVSRQRKFQLRWRKAGLCTSCRKPRNLYTDYCDSCHDRNLARLHAKYHSDPKFRERLKTQGNQWAKDHRGLASLYRQHRQQWGPKCFWPPHALEEYEQLKRNKQNTYHENTTGLRGEDIQDNSPSQLENHLRPVVAIH